MATYHCSVANGKRLHRITTDNRPGTVPCGSTLVGGEGLSRTIEMEESDFERKYFTPKLAMLTALVLGKRKGLVQPDYVPSPTPIWGPAFTKLVKVKSRLRIESYGCAHHSALAVSAAVICHLSAAVKFHGFFIFASPGNLV